VLSRGRDGRLDVELQPVLNLRGDFLEIFRIWYSGTGVVAVDDDFDKSPHGGDEKPSQQRGLL
jgi:hypothetical protein